METIALNDKQKKSRRSRNIAIAVTLAGLVALFYIITLVKFAGGTVG